MIRKISPLILIIIITVVVFFKIPSQGLYPFPGDALVSQNFPWYAGGWSGYDPWTTYKHAGAVDANRQHIPWHHLTFESIKQYATLPLWNPYNYSGTPHLANVQTFIFNPFNLLFLLLPFFSAWIIFVILQMPLTILFTYLFSRSLGLTKWSGFFAGLSFTFSSYFIFWYEIGIVGYSIMWLPLILYAIQNLLSNFKIRYLFLLILSSSTCVLAGHIQTSLFIFFVGILFFIYKASTIPKGRGKSFLLLSFWLISTLLLTAVQIIPTIELYLNSPLVKSFSKEIFNTDTMPLVNIMSLLAPDFFGSPATNNLWTKAYGDSTPNIGVLPLFFSIFALFHFKNREVRFFSALALIFILFATRSPLYHLIRTLGVPILTGTSPVRTLFVFCFSLSILAAFGLEDFIKSKKNNRILYLLIAVFLVTYGAILASTFLVPLLAKNQTISANFLVTRRNLAIPLVSLFIFLSTVLSRKVISNVKFNTRQIEIYIILVITLLVGVYQFNKTSPFSRAKDFFPEHPLISWLQDNASINRFYGQGTSRFDNNLATYYHIYSAEGYSVFRITRYAELIISQETGEVPLKYNRADAEFSAVNDHNKKRLLNLLGIKYLVLKDDFARDATKDDVGKPEDDVKLAWQDGKFKIYERNQVLPRFFLSSDFVVAKRDQEILDKIYDDNFNLHTIILEKSPTTALTISPVDQIQLLDYKPNTVSFKTKTAGNTLLFLSDTFYPGWEAKVDNSKTEIYRADYALRAVEIPQGEHVVTFRYTATLYTIGLYITLGSLLTLISLLTWSVKYKKF